MQNDKDPKCPKCGSHTVDVGEVYVCVDESCGHNIEKTGKAKYKCEKCGEGITLEAYLSVGIEELALCDKCKEARKTNKLMRRGGYKARNS